MRLIYIFTLFYISYNHARIGFDLELPEHHLASNLTQELIKCKSEPSYCSSRADLLIVQFYQICNLYSSLLLQHRAQNILYDALVYIPKESFLGKKVTHLLAILAFSQGDVLEVKPLFSSL